MDHKRPAAATIGGPSAKRVKKEIKGEGNFDRKIDLASIPMAPKVEKKPKLESNASTDHKPFNPVVCASILPWSASDFSRLHYSVFDLCTNTKIQHGQQENRNAQSRRGFRGNSIKVNRGNGDTVSAHYNQRDQIVELTCSRGDASLVRWDTTGVEREIFERLNKAHFDVLPVGGWGFLRELLDPDWFYPQYLQPYTLKIVVDVEWGNLAVQDAGLAETAQFEAQARRLVGMATAPKRRKANSAPRAQQQQTHATVEHLRGNTEAAPQSQGTLDSKVESSATIKAEQSMQEFEKATLITSTETAPEATTPASSTVYGQALAPEVKPPVLPTEDAPPPLTGSAVLAAKGVTSPQPVVSFVDSMKVLADKLEADCSPRLTNRPLFSFGNWPGTHVGGGSFTPVNVNTKPEAEEQAPATSSNACADPANSAIGLGSEENMAEATSTTK